MKTCPNCRNQIEDDAVFCPVCGSGIGVAPEFHKQTAPPPCNGEQQLSSPQIPVADPFDRTCEFAARDISENKIFAMLTYLMGPLGVILALLGAQESAYVAFHVKQSLKLTVLEVLGAIMLSVVSILLFYSRLRVFMLFLLSIALVGLFALHFTLFLQVCKGQAKELPLLANFEFLK
jgi:uncharacterized membrane protein